MERGTAARVDVPVRQTRVAELDDDVAVPSFDLKIERNETWCVDPTKRGSNITRAGTQLGVATLVENPAEVFSKENVETGAPQGDDQKLRRVKRHTFFRVISGKADDSEMARKREPRIWGT